MRDLGLSHVAESLPEVQLTLLPEAVLVQRSKSKIVSVLFRSILGHRSLAGKIPLRD